MDLTGIEAAGNKLQAEPRPAGRMFWVLTQGLRVLALTVLWAGIGMAVGLLCGIVVLMTAAVIQHQMPPMEMAYRWIAMPLAIVSGSCALLWNIVRTVQAGLRRLGHP